MLLPPEARGNALNRSDRQGAGKLRRFLPYTKMNGVVPILHVANRRGCERASTFQSADRR
jgi:hypothetical protein